MDSDLCRPIVPLLQCMQGDPSVRFVALVDIKLRVVFYNSDSAGTAKRCHFK